MQGPAPAFIQTGCAQASGDPRSHALQESKARKRWTEDLSRNRKVLVPCHKTRDEEAEESGVWGGR